MSLEKVRDVVLGGGSGLDPIALSVEEVGVLYV